MPRPIGKRRAEEDSSYLPAYAEKKSRTVTNPYSVILLEIDRQGGGAQKFRQGTAIKESMFDELLEKVRDAFHSNSISESRLERMTDALVKFLIGNYCEYNEQGYLNELNEKDSEFARNNPEFLKDLEDHFDEPSNEEHYKKVGLYNR